MSGFSRVFIGQPKARGPRSCPNKNSSGSCIPECPGGPSRVIGCIGAMIADRLLYLDRLANMQSSPCAATCKIGAYMCRVKRLHPGNALSYGHLRPRRNLRQSRPAERPPIWPVKSCRWTRYWMRWRLAADGYYWKRMDTRPSFCPHGQRLHALSKIAGTNILTVSNTAAQTSLFA